MYIEDDMSRVLFSELHCAYNKMEVDCQPLCIYKKKQTGKWSEVLKLDVVAKLIHHENFQAEECISLNPPLLRLCLLPSEYEYY